MYNYKNSNSNLKTSFQGLEQFQVLILLDNLYGNIEIKNN